MLQVAADVLRGASLSCARPLLAPAMSAPTEIPADKARNGYANRAGSTDAGVDRPQDGISENGVAHAKCQNARLVLALLRLADVMHDHVSDFLHAVRLLRKVLSQGGSGRFR
jgi:hypothetical protein